MISTGTGRTTRSGLARPSAPHTKFVNYSYEEPMSHEKYPASALQTPQFTPRDHVSYVPITPEVTGHSPNPSYSPHSGDHMYSATTRVTPTSTTFDPADLEYTMSSGSSSSQRMPLSPFDSTGVQPGPFNTPVSEYGGALSDYNSFESASHSAMWFECDLCGWTTEYEEHLSLHSKAHTGEVPFECMIGDCQETFLHTEDFLVHSNSHAYQPSATTQWVKNGQEKKAESDNIRLSLPGEALSPFTMYDEPSFPHGFDDMQAEQWGGPTQTSSFAFSSPDQATTWESTRPMLRSASMTVARTLSYGIPTAPNSDRPFIPRSHSCDGSGFSTIHSSSQNWQTIPAPATPQRTFTIPSPSAIQPELVQDTFVLGASQAPSLYLNSGLLASPIGSQFDLRTTTSNLGAFGGPMRHHMRAVPPHATSNANFVSANEAKFIPNGGKSTVSSLYCSSSGTASPRPMSPFTSTSSSSCTTGPLATPPSTAGASYAAGRPRSDSLKSIKSSGSEPSSSALLVAADGINRLLKDYSKRVAPTCPQAIATSTFIPITPISSASSFPSALVTPPRSEPAKVTEFASISPSARSTAAQRIFECEIDECGKIFKRMEHLKRHEKTHTKERPYGCDFKGCEKFFSRSDNLTQHKKTHCDKSLDSENREAKPPRKRKKRTFTD